MMANKLQFGAMGDYPLVVNGFTFQNNPESKSRLIAVAAYNQFGSGNRSRRSQGFAILPAVPISRASWSACRSVRRARHGAEGHAGQRPGRRLLPACEPKPGGRLDPTFRKRRSTPTPTSCRSPSCCRSRLRPQDLRRCRDQPATWHGVVVRTDFCGEVSGGRGAYIKALIEANAWFRADPKFASGENPGVDRHQQGGRLHLPRPGRQHDHRSDHQAVADRCGRARTSRCCRTSAA